MKSVLKSLWVILVFAVLLCNAVLVYHLLGGRTDGASADTVQPAPVTEWAAPDTELLDYYGMEPFETTLPVLYIDTHGERVTKENKIWASMAILDADPSGKARSILDTPDSQETITLNYRGASSYSRFDKKQYRFKFYEKEGSGNAKDVAFLGMGRNSEWVLNGPFLDKTLVRNRLVYGLGREMFAWAPDSRYVEVFVDGAYQGVYLAVEPVTNGESRLRLGEFGMLSGETAYIVKRDRSETETNPLEVYGKIHGKTNNDLFVDYPSARKLTAAQRNWITADISAFEQALYSKRFADPRVGYSQYIDLDCFADYFILNEAVMNNDAGNLSTYIYKDMGGKMQLAIWDFNNCYDNYQWFEQDFSRWFLLSDGWFARLLQDRAFVDRIVERYAMWRESTLSTAHILEQIDAYREELGPATDRNFVVWGYSFDVNFLSGVDRDPTSSAAAFRQLRSAVKKRFAFLDAHIEDLYDLCVN